jgi:hypothetical protein
MEPASPLKLYQTLFSLLLTTVLLLAGPAGCGPVPRPFQHIAGENNALLTLRDGTGIVVLPPDSDLVQNPAAWAEAMAEALRARDIPASTDHGNAGSRYLYSHVTGPDGKNGSKSVAVLWDLYLPEGKLLGSYALDTHLSSEAFSKSPEAAILRSIEEAADKLAAMVGVTPRATRPIPGFPTAGIHVAPFGDGPGDSTISLRKAIVAELSDSRLPVVEKAGTDDLILLCEISLSPPEGTRQQVTISWRLRSVKANEDLGVIDQSSFVPAGSLDGFWGPTALDVARGAREGILDLIQQLEPDRQARKLP